MVSSAAVRPSRTTSTPSQAPDPLNSTRCSCCSKPWANTTGLLGKPTEPCPILHLADEPLPCPGPLGLEAGASHGTVDFLRRHTGGQSAAVGRQLAVDVQHVTPHQPTCGVEEGQFTGAAVGNSTGQLQGRRATPLVKRPSTRAVKPDGGVPLPALPTHDYGFH